MLEDAVNELSWVSRSNEPGVYLAEFADSSINYIVTVWIDDLSDSRKRKPDLLEAIWRALVENNITIAFPQLDIHLDESATKFIATNR